MTKDISKILLGLDAAGAVIMWNIDKSFVKWMLGVGIISLIGFLVLSKGKSKV